VAALCRDCHQRATADPAATLRGTVRTVRDAGGATAAAAFMAALGIKGAAASKRLAPRLRPQPPRLPRPAAPDGQVDRGRGVDQNGREKDRPPRSRKGGRWGRGGRSPAPPF
jgi:hypothetical protein